MTVPPVTPDPGLGPKVPAPTVREAMAFGGFAEATLVGGSDGLERRIEWVRVMETPETPRRLRDGELLLTTGYPVKDDTDAQIELIDDVAGRGGSGGGGKAGGSIYAGPATRAPGA